MPKSSRRSPPCEASARWVSSIPPRSSGLPCPVPPLVRDPRGPHARAPDGQRQWVSRPRLRCPVRATRAPAPVDPALSAETKGKAERFIRTCLAEWAYQRSFPTGQRRRGFSRRRCTLKVRYPVSMQDLTTGTCVVRVFKRRINTDCFTALDPLPIWSSHYRRCPQQS